MRVFNLLLNAVFALSLTLAVFTAFAGSGAFSSPTGKPQEPPGPATPQNPPVAPDAGTPQVPAVQPVSAPVPVPAVPASATPAPASAPKAAAKGKKTVAKDLFGAVKEPANLAAKSIGFYAHGCLAGGKPLPVNGPAWQVMRLSRNRNWGHPSLIKYIERFAADAKEKDGWPGLLVGDLSMPRGGPMPYGHASHQVGLDVDIWYRPAPGHELSAKEREDIPMESFLSDPGHVNPAMWSPDYEKLLRRAVAYPEVARVFVNPAIKKWLCDNVKGDRAFLSKITPIMGHHDHFHVRLVCPAGNPGCEGQALKADEGCGKGLDNWIAALMKSKPQPPASAAAAPPSPAPVAKARWTYKAWKKKKIASNGKTPLTMAQLPPECETVLKAPPAPVTAAR
jgi:penicillin-insensitive murein endopeptidase